MSTTEEMEETEESSESSEMNGDEVLVVASKLKKYIKAQSGMNTSASVLGTLSARIREMCNQAISSAQSEGRKTVMDRDFGAEG